MPNHLSEVFLVEHQGRSAGRFNETEEETEGVTRRRKIDGSPPSVVSSSVSQGMTNGGMGARKGGLSFKSHGRR